MTIIIGWIIILVKADARRLGLMNALTAVSRGGVGTIVGDAVDASHDIKPKHGPGPEGLGRSRSGAGLGRSELEDRSRRKLEPILPLVRTDGKRSDAGPTGTTMPEFNGQSAYDGMGAGRDSPTHSPGHNEDLHGRGRVAVEDADTRTALALAYRERVEVQVAAAGAEDAAPVGDSGGPSGGCAKADVGSEDSPRTSGAREADVLSGDRDGGQVERRHRAGRATPEALPPSARDLPDASDIVPNIELAVLSSSKLSDYSLNPDHENNGGKANGWRELGYDVDSSEGRSDATDELSKLILDELLPGGKVEKSRDTKYGQSHTVLSGFTGPNGRHATVVTCWFIGDQGGLGVPRLSTTWAQPHRDKETET
jgi:hypothetical protein